VFRLESFLYDGLRHNNENVYSWAALWQCRVLLIFRFERHTRTVCWYECAYDKFPPSIFRSTSAFEVQRSVRHCLDMLELGINWIGLHQRTPLVVKPTNVSRHPECDVRSNMQIQFSRGNNKNPRRLQWISPQKNVHLIKSFFWQQWGKNRFALFL